MNMTYPATLKNRYYIVRHGESEMNVRGVIASDLQTDKGCLTERGRQQVRDNFLSVLGSGWDSSRPTQIYTSPLCRARETAEIISDLTNAPVIMDDRLRERDFGKLEGTTVSNYKLIWDRDEDGCSVGETGAEELEHIAERLAELISTIEMKLSTYNIVICTHGDVASTLIVGLRKLPLREHRKMGALNTGEVFELNSESKES
jgi:broad specificity phosphatase PhoE